MTNEQRIEELERKVKVLKRMVVEMCNGGLVGNGLVSYKTMHRLIDEFNGAYEEEGEEE